MAETVKIRKNLFDKILVTGSALFLIVAFTFYSSPFTPVIVFTVLLLVWGAYYALTSKEQMSEMCCMMSGMTYGMISGFFLGALFGLATGDFLIGMIVGTIAGIIFGIPVGRIGGPLGRMEGVMAGPMGGIMGGMTGVMVRFFDVGLFMPFLVLVVLFTVWEMTNVIRSHSKSISRGFLYAGITLSLLAFGSAIINSYAFEGGATGLAFGSQVKNVQQTAANAAPIVGGTQEATIKLGLISYEPNYIVLKKDVPARITLQADSNAGCTRAIVFPEFGVRKTVARGATETVEFTPTRIGTFPFSCAMNMARGTVVVQ